MARAAAAAGTAMCLSTLATTRPSEVAAAAPAAPRWFQLYCFSDEGVTRALIDEAVESGFEAIVAHRRRAARRATASATCGPASRSPRGSACRASQAALGSERAVTIAETFALMDAGLGWSDLEALAAECALPVLVKGVQTGEDAALAIEHGAAGVVVSNHGGRQLDRVPATADVLEEAVEAVAGRAPVLVDGGIRRGIDVAIALALGADAVLVGRPALWGLAAGGEAGAGRVLELLRGRARARPRPLRLRLAGRARARAPVQSALGRRRRRIFGLDALPLRQLDGPAHPQRRIAEPRPRRRRPVLGRLRQRRLLDLLRARRHRRLRPRPDPGRLRHLRPDLRRDRRHLRRGDRDVPGGRRLLELRPPRLQRDGQLHRRLGADAQLHDHGRDLGLLRAPLPGRLLGARSATRRATSSAAPS